MLVKSKINIYRNMRRLILGFTLFISVLTFSLIAQSETALAACAESVQITDNCVDQNYQEAKKYNPSLTAGQYRDAINACEGTNNVVGGIGTSNNQRGLGLTTQTGNCSNAIRSCYEHQIDQRSCRDKDVLALVADCNNGNVNSEGECGLDSSVDFRNSSKDGDDYETNQGIYTQRLNDRKDAECNNLPTIREIENCRKTVEDQTKACYNDLAVGMGGGMGASTINYPIQNAQLNDCMIKKSTTKQQCDARRGTWDEATKRCTNPNPPDSEDPDKPAAAPNVKGSSVDGKCGTARVNLLDCGEETGNVAINNVLKIFINVLSVGIGVAAVAGLAWASILYSKAEDSEGNTKEAKDLIRNIVIGLLLYGFLIAIINWLVPGGVIG